MKKILLWFFGVMILIWIYMSPVFSSTLFFTTKDGRLFCEIDSYDGTYDECALAETAWMKLEKAVFPSARLIDTPNEKICVEYSTQVDMAKCQEEIDLIKKYLTAKTGSTTQSGSATNSWVVQSGTTNVSWVTSTWKILPIRNIPVNQIQDQLYLAIENLWTPEHWMNYLMQVYNLCVPDYWSDSCMNQVQSVINFIKDIGVYTVITTVLIVLFIIVFWFDMLGHIVANPVPKKWIWFIVVLLLLFPGALIYYFAIKRPFTNAQLAAIPHSERSFF
jgi:hypothetical protein